MEYKVSQALSAVKRILDTTRSPVLPGSATRDHTYTDKFRLAELLGAQSIESIHIALDTIGPFHGNINQYIEIIHQNYILKQYFNIIKYHYT